jgi:1-phosphofructokinase
VTLRTVARESTSGWYVHDRRQGERTELAAADGAPLHRHELDELYGLALAEGLKASVSVLSGTADPRTVPAEVYRRLAADLRANGGTVVADLSGEQLAAALTGGIDFLKVSHEEVPAGNGGREETVRALHELHAGGAASVLISRAAEPALALLSGEAYEVVLPTLQTADPRGAGDSMTAGVAAVLAKGGELTDAVRTGAAAGALNVTRHGLGTGRAEVIAELIGRVRLNRLHGVLNRS